MASDHIEAKFCFEVEMRQIVCASKCVRSRYRSHSMRTEIANKACRNILVLTQTQRNSRETLLAKVYELSKNRLIILKCVELN